MEMKEEDITLMQRITEKDKVIQTLEIKISVV